MRCPVRLCFRPNGSQSVSVEVHRPLAVPTGCDNRLPVNELGHPGRRSICMIESVEALDAAVVFRAVSTLRDARNAGRCCRNDSP